MERVSGVSKSTQAKRGALTVAVVFFVNQLDRLPELDRIFDLEYHERSFEHPGTQEQDEHRALANTLGHTLVGQIFRIHVIPNGQASLLELQEHGLDLVARICLLVADKCVVLAPTTDHILSQFRRLRRQT